MSQQEHAAGLVTHSLAADTAASPVFLFDIDGTLLQAGARHHRQALEEAVERLMGRRPDADLVPLAGRTDTEILLDLLAQIGVEHERTVLGPLFDLASEIFQSTCPGDISRLVLPGVQETLEFLAGRQVVAGLVTGNIERIAWHKMELSGLRRYFAFGAFGDESGRRPDLPPLALERAAHAAAPAATYIIGDTPLDIDCGRACGMTTVAVATGRYSMSELRACEPAILVATLFDFLDLIRGELDGNGAAVTLCKESR